MQTTFSIGRRLSKYKYLGVAVNSFIVFAFYFIYRYLFEASFPNFVNLPLFLIFAAFAFVVGRVTLWGFNKYAAGVSYKLTQSGLQVKSGKVVKNYQWADFRSAKLRDGSFQNVFSVEFQIGDEFIVLNQYLDGLCLLTYEIFLRIQDHVPLDPELVQRAKNMIDVY